MKEPWFITIYQNNDLSIGHWMGTCLFQEVDDNGASMITADEDSYEILDHCRIKYGIPNKEFNTIWKYITVISKAFKNTYEI